MNRKVVSLDLDGVCAAGGFVPPELRHANHYMNLEVLDPQAPEIINAVARRNDVYIVSSRSFENAAFNSRLWLDDKGVDIDWLMGVICGQALSKPILEELNVTVHFDDDPRVYGWPRRVALFRNPTWPENLEAYGNGGGLKVAGWEEVPAMLERVGVRF